MKDQMADKREQIVEREGFRRWLLSLSRQDLLRAMVFQFQLPSTTSSTSTHRPKSSSSSSSSNNNATNTGRSHKELELMLEMVRLQSPRPTPVHPRAMGYRPRCTASLDWACLDYWQREEGHLRWTRPRLFQLVPSTTKGHQNLDPELERLLLEVGGGGGDGGSGTSTMRRRSNRSTTTTVGGSDQKGDPTSKSPADYQIVARNKVAPWGDIYGLGVTWEQQEIDRKIVQGTRLVLGRTTDKNDGKAQLSEVVSSANFIPSDVNQKDVSSILRMLQVASRGNLYNLPFQNGRATSAAVPEDYFASWLDPTKRWFSLAQYLASRYQIALVNAYRRRQSLSYTNEQQQQQQPEPWQLEQAIWDKYETHMLDAALRRAARMGLMDVLRTEYGDGDSNRHPFGSLRDGILWAILESQTIDFCQPASRLPVVQQDGWNVLRLTDASSPVRVEFKTLLRYHMDQQLVVEIEKNLWMEEEEAALTMAKNGSTKFPVGPIAARSRRRKNKSTRNKKKGGASTVKRRHSNPLPVIPASTDEEESSNENSDGDDDQNQQLHDGETNLPPTVSLRFPNNDTTPRDRNRNIIFALGILEDVMEKAFAKVGLPPTPAFDAEINAKDQNKNSKIELPKEECQCQERKKGSSVVENVDELAHLTPDTLLREDGCSNEAGVISPPPKFEQESDIVFRQQAWNTSIPNSNGLSQNFYNPFRVGRDFLFGPDHPSLGIPSDGDDFLYANRFPSRERSIFDHIFDSQDEKLRNQDDEDDEHLMAASTAASISSSIVAIGDELEDSVVEIPAEMTVISEVDDNHSDILEDGTEDHYSHEVATLNTTSLHSVEEDNVEQEAARASEQSIDQEDSSPTTPDCRSPSPEAPITPPPTLSPILVSLADLKDLKRQAKMPKRQPSMELKRENSFPPISGPGSLPTSPVVSQRNGLPQSWSREDLRMDPVKSQEQQQKRSPDLQTYRSVAVKSLARPIASSKVANVDFRTQVIEASLRRQDKELCARSETAVEGHSDDRHHEWFQDDGENHSITRDETTTITSAVSHRAEPEEMSTLREERNNWRDMCLTLGAEVAKLKAILAAQHGSMTSPSDYHEAYNSQPGMYRPGSFDPHGMQPFFHGMKATGMRPGPMSDAGFHRGGDHESQVSEDEVYDSITKGREAQVDSLRLMSSSQTVSGSDVSVDFNGSNQTLHVAPVVGTMPIYDSVPIPFQGLQSRLSKDIMQFVLSTNLQLRKHDVKRKLAVERFSRLVKTIWPRAQVKPFGSYVSGLCLPSSDMDFVICLPAVHKKDVALAPGVLEGRNAINETSQKLLARELKGESWIDPRSIKLIERTVVPVIKVSTKDTRARMIQLDISFDSPEHHGLEANRMVLSILDELPLIRPLMLVLKQFLLYRGLLTAYTGGLSSYCLFLMLARYLQEQPPSNSDCGSLLMGFLDFYGNYFDPRATGISVWRRQYFLRSNHYDPGVASYEPAMSNQPVWTNGHSHQQHVVVNMTTMMSASQPSRKDFGRHNSFSDTVSVDGNQRRLHRFQPINAASSVSSSSSRPFVPSRKIPPRPASMRHSDTSSHGTPVVNGHPAGGGGTGAPMFDFTFDPLFVEDPLSASNNVGRNAFRINQIQRVFSDGHRALVASLDWDISSSADGVSGDYPLLKCLLQGEDVLYEL